MKFKPLIETDWTAKMKEIEHKLKQEHIRKQWIRGASRQRPIKFTRKEKKLIKIMLNLRATCTMTHVIYESPTWMAQSQNEVEISPKTFLKLLRKTKASDATFNFYSEALDYCTPLEKVISEAYHYREYEVHITLTDVSCVPYTQITDIEFILRTVQDTRFNPCGIEF